MLESPVSSVVAAGSEEVGGVAEGLGGSVVGSGAGRGGLRLGKWVDGGQYRAAGEKCRGWAPELYFAGYFLPRRSRFALYVVAAVWEQLQQILEMSAAEEQGGCRGCGAGQGGGGGCVGEGPFATGRSVCGAVLEYLYSGQATGQPHLDGFVGVAREYGLAIGDFRELVEGWIELESLRRVATWSRVRGILDRAAGGVVRIVERLVFEGQGEASGVEGGARWGVQARAMVVGVLWGVLLDRIGEDWSRGRLRVPLDDLGQFGLSEGDVGRTVRGEAIEDEGRMRELMRVEVGRARNLLRGGAGCLKLLAAGSWRCALAVLCTMHGCLLDRLERDDPFERPAGNNLWARIRRIPTAIRLAAGVG